MKLLDDLLITAPESLVLGPDEFKQHARIDYATDDALIESYLLAAERHVEALTGRALITQTREARYDDFAGHLNIPVPSASSVAYVHYQDADGVWQTLSTSYWVLAGTGMPWSLAVVHFPDSTPNLYDYGADLVRIRYVAGFGPDPADVPEQLRHAIRLLASHWYEHREDVIVGMISKSLELSFRSLTEPWRFRGTT